MCDVRKMGKENSGWGRWCMVHYGRLMGWWLCWWMDLAMVELEQDVDQEVGCQNRLLEV